MVVSLMTAILLIPSTISAARSDLMFVWFESPDAAFTALQADEVDILCMDLTAQQKEAVEADPNLQISRYERLDYTEFALNNNKTILSYPDKLSPTNVLEVRQALAYLIDKDYIISEILNSQGARIDQPIPYPLTEGWCDPSVITYDWNHDGIIEPEEDNYPYKYSVDNAVRKLAQLGFNDTDGNGYLNYPDDPMWMGAAGLDTTLMPLKIVARSDHLHQSGVARYLYHQLEGEPSIPGDGILASSPIWALYGLVGGDFDTTDETWILPGSVIAPIIWELNFHVHPWSWVVGRYPLHLYHAYHSGDRSITDYEHPELDIYLEELYYAQSIPEAQDASRHACKYMADKAVTIPLWSTIAYQSWRKEVAGVVNMKGYGINNKYTYINAYRTDDPTAPLRIAILGPPSSLNVYYAQWDSDWEILNAIYTDLINVNPYDLAVDIPWIAQDWEVGTWWDNGVEKTNVTYWIRKDAGIGTPNIFVRPRNYTAHDVEFTIWYYYAFDDGWNWLSVADVHHTEILNDHAIRVYFDDKSMWFVYTIGGLPLLCKKELVTALSTSPLYPLLEKKTYSFWYWGGEYILPDSVVQVVNATVDGLPIYENKNFTIRAGYDVFCHNVFRAYNIHLELPWYITITYWYAPNPPTGYYLGSDAGLTWKDTMYTPGPHYASNEGYTYLSKNPNFFLTPLLGEIDWRWYWIGATKPRSGYFKIDILDIVKVTSAYSARGDGEFDPRYLPGADIDANDLCHIGIFDLVIVTGKYGKTFGTPPPDP